MILFKFCTVGKEFHILIPRTEKQFFLCQLSKRFFPLCVKGLVLSNHKKIIVPCICNFQQPCWWFRFFVPRFSDLFYQHPIALRMIFCRSKTPISCIALKAIARNKISHKPEDQWLNIQKLFHCISTVCTIFYFLYYRI